MSVHGGRDEEASQEAHQNEQDLPGCFIVASKYTWRERARATGRGVIET